MVYWSNDFPGSLTSPFLVTSPQSRAYNCIAYAYGDLSRAYWPSKTFYWPNHIVRSEHLNSFIDLFNSIGYVLCDNGILEPGFEKVAIFGLNQNTTKHAAKQLLTGQWSSKLGANYDVSHNIQSMEGGIYRSEERRVGKEC